MLLTARQWKLFCEIIQEIVLFFFLLVSLEQRNTMAESVFVVCSICANFRMLEAIVELWSGRNTNKSIHNRIAADFFHNLCCDRAPPRDKQLNVYDLCCAILLWPTSLRFVCSYFDDFFNGLMVNAPTARKLRDFSGLKSINQEETEARVEN